MKNIQNFHRKRPHILPPLPDLPSPAHAPTGPLLPPDLLLTESRIGSPAPKRSGPREYEYFYDGSKTKLPFPSKEREVIKLKFDLLADSTINEENDLAYKLQKGNSLNICEFESKGENHKNFPGKKFDYLQSDLKKLKLHSVLPLEETKDLKEVTKHKVLSIPSRYALLKPIGQDQIDN